jgi:lipopolysaccharide transport system permease protein
MLPVVVGFQLVAMAGMAFILSAGGVFLRDLRDVVAVFASINLFAQPILYNPLATHSWLHWVFIANPFSYVVWCWQDVLYNGHIAHPMAWVVFPIISMATFALGWTMFQRTRHAFGDAL